MRAHLRPLLFILMAGLTTITDRASAQCPGTWVGPGTLNYLCANGPFLQFDLGVGVCPAAPQATFTLTAPMPNIELVFSAFGTVGTSGSSRMAIFMNDTLIDLSQACDIVLGCQTFVGNYSVNNGCLVDAVAGSDGGISGTIYLSAASQGLTTINSLGVAVNEPTFSGTIFKIGDCNPNESCGPTSVGTSEQVGVVLSPDPFTTQATLFVPTGLNNAVLTLFNAQGQPVRQMQGLTGNEVVIQRGDLPHGPYYLRLTQNNRIVVTHRVLVADN